jgi:hypothetical protein
MSIARAGSALLARPTAADSCPQVCHISRSAHQSSPHSPERRATGDTSTGTLLCNCGMPVTPPKGRAHRQRHLCGDCWNQARTAQNRARQQDHRKQKSKPPTRARLGQRVLLGVEETPAVDTKHVAAGTGSKRRRMAVCAEEPETLTALTLDDLVDVVTAGDTTTEQC